MQRESASTQRGGYNRMRAPSLPRRGVTVSFVPPSEPSTRQLKAIAGTAEGKIYVRRRPTTAEGWCSPRGSTLDRPLPKMPVRRRTYGRENRRTS